MKARRGLQRQKSAQYHTARSLTRHNITLLEVGLGAVLAIFGFSKFFSYFLKYHHKDSKSHGNISFRKSKKNCLTRRSITLRGVWLCAVLPILDFRTFQFPDSVQYHTAWSNVFREYLCENEFFRGTILDSLSRTQMSSMHEKNAKNLVTLPL